MDKIPVIFGEVLFDCFDDGSRILGGAPFNVAWNLQAFGSNPLFVSRVGDDPLGRQIRDTMQHWGMRTAGLQKDSVHPTGTVQVTVENGEPSYEIVAERAYDFIRGASLPPMEPALIYHGTLALRHPVSAEALQTLVDKYQAPVFTDINLRPPWWEREQVERALIQARWAKLNDVELGLLLDDDADLEEKARQLRDRYELELLIITQGAEGAFTVNAQGAVASVAPSADTEVVDTVGAGDAFASVCIQGILRGWDTQTMLDRAQAFASALVGTRGATVQDENFYRRAAGQWMN